MQKEKYYIKKMDENPREIDLKNRINDKLSEIEKNLNEFQSMDIPELEEYRKDIKTKAASERYFEKIVEGIISVGLLIIRLKKFSVPESEEHAFIILAKNNIINKDLAERLKDAKDMRNRIVHNYVTVDDSIVYRAISEEITKDAEEFLRDIKMALK